MNDRVVALVAKYESLVPQQRRRYNEANTRKDFIEPLFEALGWNVRDKEEVDAERLVKPGWADYAFLVEGVPRFFLEAKPLADDLYNPQYAEQVITYAYNKGVPWAVLCNFAHIQVFNAEWETDDLNRARFLDLACEGYTQPDSPLRLLSREAFITDELDRRAQTYGGMRPRLPVEKNLYAQMRHWRERLFNEIARMRPELTFEQVDEVIERLLNRLIFIRNCEDRRVEEPVLRAALHQWRRPGRRAGLTEAVHSIFGQFDATFDSDLFALHLVDQLLASGTLFEDALGDIVTGLYAPPRSLAAYDFSVIDADVLGQVYEQYLGHIAQVVKEVVAKRERQLSLGIELPQIQLEAKRQRRKERGIYYTPKWVVDHIVRETVGRYLEEHSYDDILNVKILDPACGSGSFLIRAFDVLLDYHARVKGKAVAELDQYERLRILTANIFGVDLDQRAVDIAHLNLLLRAVARRELLPSLERNIVRGNSLISGSEEELRRYFGDTWEEKHPFNWKREFPGIMERGGFDMVIGNPPYVTSALVSPPEREYHRADFRTATGKYDLYMLFVERALALAKDGGYVSLIIPNKFMHTSAGRTLRNLLSHDNSIVEITNFDDNPVFAGVTNYPCVIVVKRQPPMAQARMHYVHARDASPVHWQSATVPNSSLGDRVWTLSTQPSMKLIDRLERRHPALCDFASRIATGIQTGADKTLVVARSELGKLEPELFRPILRGRDIKRYAPLLPTRHVFYPFQVTAGGAQVMTENELSSFPATLAYIRANEQALRKRVWYGKSAEELTGAWYGLMYLGDPNWYAQPKLITPALSGACNFTIDETGLLFVTGTAGAYGLTLKHPFDGIDSYLYALGLLNSAVTRFCIGLISPLFSGGFYKFNTQYLKRLPFPSPAKSKATSSRVATLVRRMLALHQRLAARSDMRDEARGQIERDIARTDKEIDELVYDLYGLTQEERCMVERETGAH